MDKISLVLAFCTLIVGSSLRGQPTLAVVRRFMRRRTR